VRSGTPSQMPIPKGQPIFKQVMILGNRTAYFSASLSSAGKSIAVPSFLVMLAIEYASLPGKVVKEVRGVYEDNERWLSRTLEDGRQQGTLHFNAPTLARILFDALEGAMLAARVFNDPTRLEAAIDWHLNQLRSKKR
jgi:hypothetical protein